MLSTPKTTLARICEAVARDTNTFLEIDKIREFLGRVDQGEVKCPVCRGPAMWDLQDNGQALRVTCVAWRRSKMAQPMTCAFQVTAWIAQLGEDYFIGKGWLLAQQAATELSNQVMKIAFGRASVAGWDGAHHDHVHNIRRCPRCDSHDGMRVVCDRAGAHLYVRCSPLARAGYCLAYHTVLPSTYKE